MKFIDLFAGLGGFHVGLSKLGFECVFACEIDPTLRELYFRNHGIEAGGDIWKVNPDDIPAHSVLCAGFPCQPFSKAGDQLGLDCPVSGDLFSALMRIARRHRPTYMLLENVPNLVRHNGGRTWYKQLRRRLRDAGYAVDERQLSPHRFGIPQIRERLFVVASLDGLDHFEWPEPTHAPNEACVASILDTKPSDARALSAEAIECLEVWQDFVERYPKDEHLPSFPIWSMEFGATYPYEDFTPHAATPHLLARRCGCHGLPLRDLPPKMRAQRLPSYARSKRKRFPGWKIDFIRQNRQLYDRNRAWIDAWMPQVLPFAPSLQKFEWNCKGAERDVWKHIIQFRASGVRIKRATSAPSLVAMTTTQVPIIGWERRYMTVRECARLQSLGDLKQFPSAQTKAFKALGNAVNAELVRLIAERLCRSSPVIVSNSSRIAAENRREPLSSLCVAV